MENVRFFPFPTSSQAKRKWLQFLRRKDLSLATVSRHHRVCSRHWINGDGPSPNEPHPTLFAHNGYKKTACRKTVVSKNAEAFRVAPGTSIASIGSSKSDADSDHDVSVTVSVRSSDDVEELPGPVSYYANERDLKSVEVLDANHQEQTSVNTSGNVNHRQGTVPQPYRITIIWEVLFASAR